MNKRRLTASRRLTLGAMIAALTVLCLYAAAVLPTGRIVMYFLSSVFVYVLACEGAYGSALLSCFASAGIAFLLLPDKLPVLAYTLLLGHYGITRTALRARMDSKLFPMLLMLLYCNFFSGTALYASKILFGSIPIIYPDWLPSWALIIFVQLGFLLFDVLYGIASLIYEARLRRMIVPRR